MTNLQAKTSNFQGIIFAMLPMAVAADWCHAGKLCEAPLALCPAGPGEITAWMEESHHLGQFWSTLVREIQKLAQANVGGAGHFLVMNPNR
jgi:hypothetical protein